MTAKLEEQLKALHANLEQISMRLLILKENTEPSSVEEIDDLCQLRSDMQELLELKEEELLEEKKNALLAMCDSHLEEFESTENVNVSSNLSDDAYSSFPSSSSLSIIKSDVSLNVGDRCLIPYWTNLGMQYLHICIICQVDLTNGKVRVMLSHPTQVCDIPCNRWFDDEGCPEGVLCSYSHGIVIDATEVKPYEEPCFEDVRTGSRCLVRLTSSSSSAVSDQLWQHAIVEFVDSENSSCVVKLSHNQRVTNVQFSYLFPLQLPDNESLSSSDLSGDDNSENDEERVVSASHISSDIQTTERLGEWETHTRGIASKLMVQMGYVPGQGLGAQCQGRVFSVPIELLPAGRSLDEVMRIRQTSLLGEEKAFDPFQKKKKHFHQRKHTSHDEKPQKAFHKSKSETNFHSRKTVFDFINSKTQSSQISDENSSFSDQKSNRCNNSKDLLSDKSLNVKLMQLHDEIKHIQRDIQKAQLAFEQRGTTSGRSGQIELMKKKLNSLMESERMLSQEKKGRKDRRNFSVF